MARIKMTTDNGSTFAPRPSPEAIARRAYELFEARGGVPGHELEDWLRAEAELAQRAQGAPATAAAARPPAAAVDGDDAEARRPPGARATRRRPIERRP
jgi:hypothetical protein